MIFILLFVEKYVKDNAIHNFSEWLKTGSNPADINLFRNHIGIKLTYLGLILVGDELSDLEDFLVGELDGDTWSVIRTIPEVARSTNTLI